MPEPVTPPAPVDPPAPATPPPAADPPAPVDPPAPPPASETPEQTIARLDAELKKARAEAGNARVNAKTQAADEARKELAKSVGLALGIIEPENIDPAKLTEQVASSTAQARQAQVELAVFRAADAAGGDPIALLDSRAFLEKVATLEPTDTVGLTSAITEAVAANTRLGRATPGTAPGPTLRPNPAQGSSGSPPLDLTAQIAAAESSKAPLRERMALKAQLAATQQK